MDYQIKHQSFRSFLRASTISLVILITLMSYFMFHSYQDVAENNAIINDSMNLIEVSDYLQKGSDKLTENVRFFVLTTDEKYLDYYIEEACFTKTREQGFTVFESQHFNVDYSKLEAVKQLSDDLLEKELWMMRLVCESEGRKTMPDILSDVTLSPEESALSAEKKYALAKDYLLFGSYNRLKAAIDSSIADVNKELNQLAQEKIDQSTRTTTRFLIYKTLVFVLFTAWCIIMLVVLNRKIIKPILSYKQVYQALNHSAKAPSLVSPCGMKEVYQLGLVYNQAMIDINHLKCKVEEKNIALETQKNIDPLTGVYNRGVFDTELWQEIEESDYTVFCIDVNKFKAINDSFGHPTGDQVLQFITINLQTVVRRTDLIIRAGGDEFILVVRDTIDDEIITRIDNKLTALQGKVFCRDNVCIPTYFEHGFATHRKGNRSFDEVVSLADKRLYENKHKAKK